MESADMMVDTHRHFHWDDLSPKGHTIEMAGQHICWLYKNDRDHHNILLEYVTKGLEHNERLLYVAKLDKIHFIRNLLKEHGIDHEALEKKGQLIFKDAEEVYIRDGAFDPDYMINLLKNDLTKCIEEGYSGLRASGEMNWCMGAVGGERVFEYEAKLNLLFQENPKITGMCQYDMRSFHPATLLKVLNTHPIAIRDGDIYDNFYYIPPEELLTQDLPTVMLEHWLNNLALRKQDNQKIYQKTVELRAAHESIIKASIEKERIELAKALAEAQNQAKSVFLHHMSHEMRTPLNGILGTCSILEQQIKTEPEKESVSMIKDCADHLLTVIKDILDLALIESGKLVIEHKPMEIRNCIDSVYKILGENKTVSYHVDKDVPEVIISDLTRIKQVLLNMISNGIKFSPENARVEVLVKALDVKETTCDLQFSVKDNGIGIKPEQFSSLFKPFSQLDNTVTRRFDGTGLGLSICKRIVEAMKGAIWVDSVEGHGSTFYFRIPVEIAKTKKSVEADEATSSSPKLQSTRKLKVLIAEDNLVNQKLAVRMVSKLGHDVTTAINGIKAIECVKQAKFDVIFMDLNMPEMGGIEATAVINAMDWSKSQRPSIIALTACAFKEDRVKCLQVGMEDFIAKPFTLPMIQKALDSYITNHPETN